MEQIQDWVSGTLGGDPALFDRIVGALRGNAVAVAYSRLGDYHLAQDAAQMAFVVAFQNLKQLRDPEALPAWLRRITLSQCSRICRKRTPLAESLDDALDVASSEQDPGTAVARDELRARLRAEIRALPDHQQTALRLYYDADCSAARIARDLDLPLTTVKKRLHDARKNLRKRFLVLEDRAGVRTMEGSKPDES